MQTLIITDGDATGWGGDENGVFIDQLRVFGCLLYLLSAPGTRCYLKR
jgi:hypothetical protein